MRQRRRAASALAASPVLVGAVTVLTAIITVFIAYTANLGLPFVPTYDIKAEFPSGNKLLVGNDVRLGGFRVGVVDEVEPKTIQEGNRTRSIAIVGLKIDKAAEPLPVDTHMEIRPRSALGLKYVQVDPGRSRKNVAPGDTVPLRNNSEPLEIEDVLSTFQPRTRDDIRKATTGFGDAFAGRGRSINTAIESLNPLLRALTPVMRNLADPETGLERFVVELSRAAAQVAPVAGVQAALFTNMADTFAAIGRDARALQLTIEKGPSTQDVAISSFRASRPFLADFTDLSRRLRPAVRELPRSLPALNDAFRVGTPVLPKTVRLSDDLREATLELEDLFENPNTLLSLQDLDATLTVTRPALEFIGPYQTVCNDAVYFLHGLGEHMSLVAPGREGTVQNQGAKLDNLLQPNHYGKLDNARPVDVAPGQQPKGATFLGTPAHRFQSPWGAPAVDAQGNADCQHGQEGYPNGRFSTGSRYGPGALPDGTPSGGNGMVSDPNYPILSGGTDVTRRLGITNLRDVP